MRRTVFLCLSVLFLAWLAGGGVDAMAADKRASFVSYDRGYLIVDAGQNEGLAEDDVLYVYERGPVITNPLTGRLEEMDGGCYGIVTVVAFRDDGARSVTVYEGEYIDFNHLERYYLIWE